MSELPTVSLPQLLSQPTTTDHWEKSRRPELLDRFRRLEYGITPVLPSACIRFSIAQELSVLCGKGVKKAVDVAVDAPIKPFSFRFWLYLPTHVAKAPAFVMINNRTSGKIRVDIASETDNPFWPVEYILSRGYATAAFNTTDIDLDINDGNRDTLFRYQNGILQYFEEYTPHRDPSLWQTISAWAWAASRVMDYLVTDPGIDSSRVGVIGHSRGGKTALWCGAQDQRFHYVISNNSGCSGAAVARGNTGEQISDINRSCPFWFCDNYKQYSADPAAMPFDQHMLLALIAPRLLYIGSSSEDSWADPKSEYRSAVEASPAYHLYGFQGVRKVSGVLPDCNQPLQEGRIGYHVKSAGHSLTVYDWEQYINFEQRHAGQ